MHYIHTVCIYAFPERYFLAKFRQNILALSDKKPDWSIDNVSRDVFLLIFWKMGVDLPLVVAVSANASRNTAPVPATPALREGMRETWHTFLNWDDPVLNPLAVVWVTIMNSFQSGILSIHIQEFTWKSDQNLSHRWQDIASIFVGLQKTAFHQRNGLPGCGLGPIVIKTWKKMIPITFNFGVCLPGCSFLGQVFQ